MTLHCELGVMQRRFINRYQGGFPLTERPFKVVAAKLGTTEIALISLIGNLLDCGILSRFGPLYDATRLGGDIVLAAMRVPEAQFDEIAAQVNARPAVAHNYRREHDLNMWFVVSAGSRDEVVRTLDNIEQETGIPVYRFPKLHEFYLGLWFQVNGDGSIETVPVALPPPSRTPLTDSIDREIIAATQEGLPLVKDPWKQIANAVNIPAHEVQVRLLRMVESGVIRRIGAIPNHYRLGLRSNAMTVWDIPDEDLIEFGTKIGQLPFVSHCYERPRYPGVWPYNLFAMVHGSDRTAVVRKIDRIATELEGHCRSHAALYSTKILKKTGMRLEPRE